MARRARRRAGQRIIVAVLAAVSTTIVEGCYASFEVGGFNDEDAAAKDASAVDARREDSGHSVDAGLDASDSAVPSDAGFDAAVNRLPVFCIDEPVDTVRLELTARPFLTLVQNTAIRRFDTDGTSWATAGGTDVTPGFQPGCDVRLSHRADTALETGSCIQGVTHLSSGGATRELNHALARTTTDTVAGGNVTIASSTVLRYDGSVWRLELDLAPTVATEGMLRAVAHEGAAGLLLGVGRKLLRTTAPLQTPANVHTFPANIVSLARDGSTATTLVGTSAGIVYVVRNDSEQGSFETNGEIEEIFVRAPDSFLVRTRTSVFQLVQGVWSSAFTSQANEHLGDVAIDDVDVFAVVVRDGVSDPCDRIRFVPLE